MRDTHPTTTPVSSRAAADAVATLTRTYDALRATAAEDTWMTSHSELLAHYPGSAPEYARTFDTLADMRRYVESTGSHYFDAAAVRFFNGRTHRATTTTGLYGGRYWVESRRFDGADGTPEQATLGQREYSIAWVDNSGRAGIERLGSYPSLREARAFARALSAVVSTLDGMHADYPHHPGSLYDCAACEARCWCDASESAPCVYGADDDSTVHYGTSESRRVWAEAHQ